MDHSKIINLIFNSTSLINDRRSLIGKQGIFLAKFEYQFQIIPELFEKLIKDKKSHPPDGYIFNEKLQILQILEVKSQNEVVIKKGSLLREAALIVKLKDQIKYYCSEKHIDTLPFKLNSFEIIIVVKDLIIDEILNALSKWVEEREFKNPIIIWKIGYLKERECYTVSKIFGEHIDVRLNEYFESQKNLVEIPPLEKISYILDPDCPYTKIAHEIIAQVCVNLIDTRATHTKFTESIEDFVLSCKTCLVPFKKIKKIFSQLLRTFPWIGRYESNEDVYILKKQTNYNRLHALSAEFLRLEPRDYKDFIRKRLKERNETKKKLKKRKTRSKKIDDFT